MEEKILNIIKDIDSFYAELYSSKSDNIHVNLKENGTSVSQFDIDATKYCIDIINNSYSNANIWIEEDQAILKDDKDEYTWIIDPLDGTASFLRGYPVWGIGVAVLKNKIPILSYFFAPACNQKYLSYKDKIFINDKVLKNNQNILNNDTKTIFISSRLHKKVEFSQFSDYKIRNFGSTLYHLFMVVLGKAESCIISSCYIWDLAAVFELAKKQDYKFIDFKTKDTISVEDLLKFKSNKIDIILEFKKIEN